MMHIKNKHATGTI